MRRIIFRRGLETNTPQLAVGEPGFSTDTGKFYIGSPGGNRLIGPIDLTTPAYKGFKAHYGKMFADEPSINKLVIYKEAAAENIETLIDTSTEDDYFEVRGLSESDFVALINIYGSSTSLPLQNSDLMAFLEALVDNVILDANDALNSVSAMKTLFYENINALTGTLPEGSLYQNFEFFRDNFDVTTSDYTGGTGTGFEFGININSETMQYSFAYINELGTGYLQGDIITIPGTFFNAATPANDCTVTIGSVNNGQVQTVTAAGNAIFSVWPSNNINDGGADQYDNANYITTDLSQEPGQNEEYYGISYNNGNVVSNSPDFGGTGASYVVVYQDSIFGLFATGISIDVIETNGNSGFDGNGRTEVGSLFDPSAPGFGDFVVSGLTITGSDEVTITNESSDEDMRIRAGDDLYLEAYGDDLFIRSADDVRIQTNYDFSESEYGSEWQFASDGTTYLAKNSSTNDTYLSTPSNNTEVSLEITAGRDIYLRTGGYDNDGQGGNTSVTFKFDDEGNIIIPSGGNILDSSGNSLLGGSVDLTGYATEDYVDQGIVWSISASGSSSYTFSGPGIVSGNTDNPVLYLQRGFTYTFVNTTGTNHPFAIRVSNGGAAYTSGVSGSQTGTQTFTVPMDAPSTLYYQCTIHSAMGNTINIIDAKDIYGCFHKLASLTAPAADTVYNFDWYTDTTVHESEGVTVTSSNPTRISIAKSGKYSVFTEMIVRINGVGERNVFLWLAKNGTDIPETGVKVSLRQGGVDNPIFETLAKQWFLDDINANDYIELRYALNRVDLIQLEYTPAQTEPYIRPAMPSATITIIEV
jgi:hypothetical protein